MKLALSQFSINVEAEFSKEAPVAFRNIKISLDFKGLSLRPEQKNRLLEFIKNCPVHNTLENPPQIDIFVV